MNTQHPAAERLWIAIEALAVDASPIDSRVGNAWKSIAYLPDRDFAGSEELDLFASIRERMKAPTEAKLLDVARDMFRLFQLVEAAEAPQRA